MRWRAIRRDRRGSATVELALWASLFAAGMMVAVDFGLYLNYQLKLGAAVEQAAVYGFNTRTAVNQTTVQNYATAASALPGTSTVVGCNGGTANCVNTGRTCACVSGSAPTYATAACGSTCPGNTGTAGYYMSVTATYPYQPVIVPNDWLESKTIRQSAVVRLQ